MKKKRKYLTAQSFEIGPGHKGAQKKQKIYNKGKSTDNPNERDTFLKRTGPQLPLAQRRKKKKRNAWLFVRSSHSGRMLPNHGTGVRFILYELMSINLIRFLASQKKRAQRYHTDALRYRGVVYKEIDWWWRGGSIPPPVIGIGPYEDTLCRHDGGIDHKKLATNFLNV